MRTLAAVAQAIAAEIHCFLVWLMPPDEECPGARSNARLDRPRWRHPRTPLEVSP